MVEASPNTGNELEELGDLIYGEEDQKDFSEDENLLRHGPVRSPFSETEATRLLISPGLLKFHLSKTPLVLLTTFSFLPGNILYHKIALLDKRTRNLLN